MKRRSDPAALLATTQSWVAALLALWTPTAFPQSVIQLAPPTLSVPESWSDAVVTVQRSSSLETFASARFETADLTAVAGTDYRPVAGVVTFLPGQSQQAIHVAIINDALPEPMKEFVVRLSNPAGGAILGTNTASIVRILDNDTGIQLDFNRYAVSAIAQAVFVGVTRGPDENFAAAVDYATSDLTAKAGQDYLATAGTLNFGPDEWRKDVLIPVISRESLEAKSFRLTLRNPTAGTALGRNAGADLILQGFQPGATFAQPIYAVSEGAGEAIITVRRGSYLDLGPFSVDYATSDGTGAAGIDYTPRSGTLHFAAGDQVKSFAVPIANNGAKQDSRTVNLALSHPTGPLGLGVFSAASIRIDDNDTGVGFDQTDYSVWRNAGQVSVTITRGNDGTHDPVTAQYETFDLSGTAGQDYQAVSGTLILTTTATAKVLKIPILPAAISAGRKTFAIVLRTETGNGVLLDRSTATVEILDLRTAGGTLINVAPRAASGLSMSALSSGVQQVSWSTAGKLQRADGPQGDWETLPLAQSPLTVAPTAPACFFRISQARPAGLFVPSRYNGSQALPLIIVLHAYGTTSRTYQEYLRLAPIADASGFFYCCPEGTTDAWGNQFWNATDACCNAFGSGIDDAAYLRDLIAEISRTFAVDRKRIYLVGHSNGGFMAYRMACENAGLIAGIASIGGATFLHPQQCAPVEPVNILQVHGTADLTVLYEGGRLGVNQAFPIDFPEFPSAMETVQLWAAANGCGNPVTDPAPTLDLDLDVPGLDTTVTRYTAAPPGGAVELWSIQGGAHSPAFFSGNAASQFAQRVVDWLLAHPKP